jgi:hypothetical protein
VGEGRTDEPATTQRRVPVAEAAKALGISEGAVRMRVKRRTLPSTREGGRLYVLLNTEPTPDPERTHDRTSELIAALREQLQAERQAHAEARRIIGGLIERMPPQIEAPQEARESPVSPGPSDTPTPAPEEAQEAAEPPRDRTNRLQQELLETRQLLEDERSRPWWRRWFGG